MNALETVDARLLWKITLQEQAAFDLRSRPRDSVLFLCDGLDDAAVLALAPEIELLITAGDFQSVLEALVVGVPVLGLPHSAEQVEGVNAVVRAGAGLRLDGKSFSESSLRAAADRMLVQERATFKASAEHLGGLVKTGGGVERAVDELLAVAEFGARHLLPMRNLQPLYKTYLVDVYLIYGAILCGAAIILRTFVSVLLSIFQPLMPLEVLEAEELAANGQMGEADAVVGRKTIQ
jgi:2-hydroxyacylsphingosine 1-beta-galactosyltransferase